MTDQLYRMKPLEWEERANGCVAACTPVGEYFATKSHWHIEQKDGYWIVDEGEAISLEAAKEAAEQHYRERLMEALEPVDVKDIFNDGFEYGRSTTAESDL